MQHLPRTVRVCQMQMEKTLIKCRRAMAAPIAKEYVARYRTYYPHDSDPQCSDAEPLPYEYTVIQYEDNFPVDRDTTPYLINARHRDVFEHITSPHSGNQVLYNQLFAPNTQVQLADVFRSLFEAMGSVSCTDPAMQEFDKQLMARFRDFIAASQGG